MNNNNNLSASEWSKVAGKLLGQLSAIWFAVT